MIYLAVGLTISIAILGIHYLVESLSNNLLGVSLEDVEREFGKLAYPLIYCPTCMTSVWGVSLILGFDLDFNLFEYFITIAIIGFFNHVFSKYI